MPTHAGNPNRTLQGTPVSRCASILTAGPGVPELIVVRNLLITSCSVAILAALLFLWFWPRGESQYCDSPDGRWRAHASAFSRGTVLGSRHRYVELRLERLADRAVVWKKQIPYMTGEVLPDYSANSNQSLLWAPDSSWFSTMLRNGMTMVPVQAAAGAQPVGPGNGSQPLRPDSFREPGPAGSRP